ncbi:MAG TPA: DNA mismatch repair protein MutS, partial [Methanothrix soehngenii]|nr:DNA mismatch repair protein MutS [Methanothrix soehngenii]
MDLPGVGPRLRERLREHYGDEEKALQAVRDGDLLGLCSTLSERQALQLVQYARALKFRVSPDEFLATDEAVRIYSLLISRLAGFAHTEYARLKIGTLFPSSSQELIEENRLAASRSLEVARRMEGLGIEEQLRSIRPLRERSASRVRERAVAASSAEDFQRLKSRGLDRLIDLHLAESPQELLALARSYSVVSLVGGGMVDVEEVERAESLEDWYLVPEAVLGFYRENMQILAAAVEAASKLRAAGVEDFQGWEDFFDLISRLGDKSDIEAERLSRLAARLEGCVDQAASTANEELKRRIENSSLTLDGT